MLPTEDIIAALATPSGFWGYFYNPCGVVQRSIEAVGNIFTGKVKLEKAKSHTIHYGIYLIWWNGDDVLVSIFRAPNSYTGEDSVEISIHGNPLIANKILELLTRNDIRLAEPGEFTKELFLTIKWIYQGWGSCWCDFITYWSFIKRGKKPT